MNKNYINSWLNIAIEDSQIFNILYSNEKYSNAFYHFQQAAEKGLKAYAFMCSVFKSQNDANSTGHYTLKLFIDQAKQKETSFLIENGFDKISGNNLFDPLSF